ncbi:hypothetical protein DMJ13_14425 [halophilic archaeon]|nr:hypothetical protein DMJ13_14425 [halophilic archaeon]
MAVGPRRRAAGGWPETTNSVPSSHRPMATCPHCESNITEWAERLEQASAASTPKVWTCPDCDSVLGISDWGSSA